MNIYLARIVSSVVGITLIVFSVINLFKYLTEKKEKPKKTDSNGKDLDGDSIISEAEKKLTEMVKQSLNKK